MNNNFVKFAIVGITCAAVCTATVAAPKGGSHGGNGRPGRPTQQTRTHQTERPAAKPKPAQQTRNHQAIRPETQPWAAKHAAPGRHVNQPVVARHEHARPKPRHHAPPPRAGRHHVPNRAHYWARPAIPAWRVGALRAWEWIEEEWLIVVNGVYYYGDGYYYDGYNYYYNGSYHTVPPTSLYA